jgi:hypothetical protein
MNLLYLAGTLLALAAGPVLYGLLRSRPSLVRGLDLFVMLSISLLMGLDVIPDTYAEGGAISLAFVVVGALGPSLFERLGGRLRREAHMAALWLALAGLVLHALADGTGLAPGPSGESLGIAVVIHSLPVGLMVWWLVAPVLGTRWAAGALLAMIVATILGYVLGAGLGEALGSRGMAWVQAWWPAPSCTWCSAGRTWNTGT